MLDLQWQQNRVTKTGKNILLRYIQKNDAELLTHFINPIVDEDTFILLNHHQTIEAEEKYIKECIAKMKQNEMIKVCALHEGKIIGVCDLNRGKYKHDHLGTIGISVKKEFRGDGVGRLLMTEVIRQSKELLGLKLLRLTCFVQNTSAIALYESLAFIEYGRLPMANFYKGQYTDQISMYKALDEE